MAHAIKGRSLVTQNENNVVFVITCFINKIREKHHSRRGSVTKQLSVWISIAPC